MDNRIYISDWHQLDFEISIAKITLQNISKLMKKLISKKLIDKWFYLFEGATIRVRMHSTQPADLEKDIKEDVSKMNLTISSQHPFEGYWEAKEAFDDIKAVETFADMMSSLTALTITRFEGKKFSNYKLVERLSHCIFNNTYGSDTEPYFMLKRLGIHFQLDDDPEQSILDDEQQYQITNPAEIKIGGIRVPIKKQK